MKYFSFLSLIFILTLPSCTSVRVASDYNQQIDFSTYKSYAFYKPGIDKASINDIDKKRILKAIEAVMDAKGFTKSSSPDILISIFTKTKENINIYQNNFGYGWGWSPWYWNTGYNTVSTTTQGTLYIDLIGAVKKELIWQGMGTAVLTQNVHKKQEKINKIVTAILEKYPPQAP